MASPSQAELRKSQMPQLHGATCGWAGAGLPGARGRAPLPAPASLASLGLLPLSPQDLQMVLRGGEG